MKSGRYPMSTNVRRRPSLWSYFSFSPSPSRRQSISLLTRNPVIINDPYEKADRHANGIAPSSPSAEADITFKIARMGQGPRWRLLRVAGVLVVLVLLILVLAPKDNSVTRYVGREFLPVSRLGTTSVAVC